MNKHENKKSQNKTKEINKADIKTRGSKTSSISGNSRKNSLNETISELESNPGIIKEKYKELIEENSYPIIESSNNSSNDDQGDKKSFSLTRLIITLILVGLAFYNSYFKIYVPNHQPTEITDYSHKFTTNLHNFLKENVNVRLSLVNTTAFIQDLGVFSLCLLWIFRGKTWRPAITFACFFAFKLLNTASFTMKPIEGFIWDSPEYISLTYPASHENYNFFFNGLVGLNFICFEFLFDIHSSIATLLSFLCLINTIFQFVFFLSLRACYIIDVGSSLLAAHYFYYLSEYLDPYFQSIYRLHDADLEYRELSLSKLNEEEEKISELQEEVHKKIGRDEVYLKRKHDSLTSIDDNSDSKQN
jgi:hypothetical protein